MVERTLKFTREARRCIREIHAYIALDNPSAAARVAEGLYQKAQLLKTFAEMGYCLDKEHPQSLRVLLYGHYRIVYRIEADDAVSVIGVFHGAMNLDGRFEKN